MPAIDRFLKRLAATLPTLVGRTIYLAPNRQPEIACVLQKDGTLSPLSNPERSFGRAADMARFKLGHAVGSVRASNDLFLESGRRKRIREFVNERAKLMEKGCTGFVVNSPSGQACIRSFEMWHQDQVSEQLLVPFKKGTV